jgi:hypothetical protein
MDKFELWQWFVMGACVVFVIYLLLKIREIFIREKNAKSSAVQGIPLLSQSELIKSADPSLAEALKQQELAAIAAALAEAMGTDVSHLRIHSVKRRSSAPTLAPATSAPPSPAMSIGQQEIAVIAAAIAEAMGTDISKLRIHSIKKRISAGLNSGKQQEVAAIAAAIAETMGTDVSKLRIHSIKRRSQAIPG